jgi:hypothetical protein
LNLRGYFWLMHRLEINDFICQFVIVFSYGVPTGNFNYRAVSHLR